MEIRPEKKQELEKRMEKLSIREEELVEKFILGSGKGGQKINKTSSCVYLKHLPSGTEVKCQQGRSREMNRFYARRLLCEKIEEMVLGEKSRKQQEIEKIRRQKQRRSRKTQAKLVENKRHRAEIREGRKSIDY